jgi:hypothetical protein
MKKSILHITKKYYTTPKIEEVEIDREMSLVMVTMPPVEPDPEDPEDPGMPASVVNPQAVNYGSQTYKSASSPFGDTSRPQY